MSDDIFKAFTEIFPGKSLNVLAYRPHGKNAITLWFSIGKPLIFTYKDDGNWILEPYKMIF